MATSTANSCIYYNYILAKQIPCFIVPGFIYTRDQSSEKYCKIIHDYNNFTTGSFNVSTNEVIRYSTDTIKIIDIYPNTNPTEYAYSQACIPNLIGNQSTFEVDELTRKSTIVSMLLNVTPLQPNFFYNLADFISYDLLFTYLTDLEREFMAEISNVLLTEVPPVSPGLVLMITMCNNLFSSFPQDNTQMYYIQNVKNLAAFSYISFPIPLNIPILKQNITYLINNGI